MSIYCTSFELDDEGDEDGRDGPAPLKYLKSHVMPTLDDPRGGSLDLGEIPGFITVDGKCLTGKVCTRPDIPEDCCEHADEHTRWPFLRVSVRPDSHPSMAEYSVLIEHAGQMLSAHQGCPDYCAALRLGALITKVADPEDTVVLDRSQVVKLRDHLTDWLGRTT
jgi:hypothetical protein